MKRLMAMIARVMSSFSFQTVWEHMQVGGRMVWQATTRIVPAAVGAFRDTAADTLEIGRSIATLPLRILGAGRGQGAAGPQANQAAQKTQTAAEQAQQADRQMSVGRAARLLVRLAKSRVDGKDFGALSGALPKDLVTYVTSQLTVAECALLSETDPQVIGAFLSGRRESIPGLRTPEQCTGRTPDPRLHAERPADIDTSPVERPVHQAEAAVMSTLQARLLAMGRQPHNNGYAANVSDLRAAAE